MSNELKQACTVGGCAKPRKSSMYCSMHESRMTRTGRTDLKTVAERIAENSVAVPIVGCWIWSGALTADGYGRMKINGKSVLAHRASLADAEGGFDNDLCVCHRCDTPACVNPHHLFLGTNLDNVSDRVAKGRTSRWVAGKFGALHPSSKEYRNARA